MKATKRIEIIAVVAGVALGLVSVLAAAEFPLPPAPNGACVFKNGSCQIAPENLCRRSKGTWLGPDTVCP